MHKQIKKPPLLGPAEQEDGDGESIFNLTNAASATECTGLIQVPPESEDELEHYHAVYSFSPTRALPPKPHA